MESTGHIEISKTQMIGIELVSIISMIVLLTQGIVSTIIDAAIVVIALSIVGYAVLYVYIRTNSKEREIIQHS